jgi:hypothetical protein
MGELLRKFTDISNDGVRQGSYGIEQRLFQAF